MAMTVTVCFEQKPPDHKGGHDLSRRKVSFTGVDYFQARDEAYASLPDGWRTAYIVTGDDPEAVSIAEFYAEFKTGPGSHPTSAPQAEPAANQ